MNVQKEMPSLRMGKKGYGPFFLEELLKYLKKNPSVKVKILKNILETSNKDDLVSAIVSDVSKKFPIHHKVVGNVLFIEKAKK